jgi:hypothetical protein
MRPDAAERCVDPDTPAVRNGEAVAAARGGGATCGRRPRNNHPSRGGVESRAGAD